TGCGHARCRRAHQGAYDLDAKRIASLPWTLRCVVSVAAVRCANGAGPADPRAVGQTLRLRNGLIVQVRAVITCAWILPQTGPLPCVTSIIAAARSTTASRRLGSRASISLRSGVPLV